MKERINQLREELGMLVQHVSVRVEEVMEPKVEQFAASLEELQRRLAERRRA